MITLSELQSEIKNIEIICPYCFKYEIMDKVRNENLSIYIDILKRIYDIKPKCSLNLNTNCLKKGTVWCTGCLNWICSNCSLDVHICSNSPEVLKASYKCDHPSKVYITDRNPSNLCSLHNKPYLFYCDYHKFLCEECEDCDLPRWKQKNEFSHGSCYFGPIINLQLQTKIKIIEEKIEKSINFFNTYIFKLYNDNKNKYKNGKRKRFNHNFKMCKKNFVSFLEFILLLIKTSKKIMAYTFFAYEYINSYTFEYKKFKYDKNIKNKSLNNFNSQLSNYFATQFFPIKKKDNDENEDDEDNVDLSKYNLKLILKNFIPYDNTSSFVKKEISIKVQEFNSLETLEFNENYFIQFDEQDLKYKNILREELDDYDEYFCFDFYPMLKHQNGNIYCNIDKLYFGVLEEIKNKKSKNNLYKIIYLKSMKTLLDNADLKEAKLITKDSLALIGYNRVFILSAFYPFSILKTIKYSGNGDFKLFFLLYNPDIFIILNNGLFLMQVYNKNNYELISSRKGLFGQQILEINSNIILITYLSTEENAYLMIIVNIHSLKALDCISHRLSDDFTGTFKLEKNPEFYLYSNQIEYLAIHYPKFLKNNYFIKNDAKIKNIHERIKNVVLLKNDIISVLCDKGLIIESKKIIIPYVRCFCLTDENDIIICFTQEYKYRICIDKLQVIKLKENDYEIINTNKVNSPPENIAKISNNRYIMYYFGTNDITLWKLNDNYSLEYLLKTHLNNVEYYNRLEEIFVINEDIIIPKYNSYRDINFWKINEDNTLININNVNIGYSFLSVLKYDNILLVLCNHTIAFFNLNNYQIIKIIENLECISCMTKLMNGNILLGFKGDKNYDIVECKFNKTTCDFTKLKLIDNAYYTEITKIIEMENGNIISYQSFNNFIIIWNRKDLKK